MSRDNRNDATEGAQGLRRRVLLAALAIGLLSRALVLITAVLTPAFFEVADDQGQWVREDSVLPSLARWDAGFYFTIAEHGYSREALAGGVTNLPFFPLYPMAVRLLAQTGLSVPDAALLISNFAFLVGCAMVALAAGEMGRSHSEPFNARLALVTTTLTAFFPWSAFASFPYTEALFLFLATTTLVLIGRHRLLAASIVAALASATRPVGIGLAVAIALPAWTGNHRRLDRLAPLLAAGGLFTFMGFLWSTMGDPLAFVRAVSESAWRPNDEGALLAFALAVPRSVYHLLQGRLTFVDLDVWIFLGAAAILWQKRRDLPMPWLAYAAVGLLMPIASASTVSMGRYVFPMLPVHAGLAMLIADRPRLRLAIIVLYALALGAVTARYVTWRWAG